MRKHEAMVALTGQAEAIKALGTTSLYIFGSTVRDDATPDSDIDLLIDYDRASGCSIIELVGIKQMLEDRMGMGMGMGMGITTRDSLDPMLRDKIEMSAERIF